MWFVLREVALAPPVRGISVSAPSIVGPTSRKHSCASPKRFNAAFCMPEADFGAVLPGAFSPTFCPFAPELFPNRVGDNCYGKENALGWETPQVSHRDYRL